METLYKLTERERDTISNLDQSDVIAAGPWRKGAMTLAHRVVIRDLADDEYVVHTQIIGDSKAYYEHGTYVHCGDPAGRLEDALVEFDKRIRRHHNLPTYTRQ